jgi:hypothetical protein
MNQNQIFPQQKTQTNHFQYKQNETSEAAILGIVVFISLIVFVLQS